MAGCACTGNAGNVFPATAGQRSHPSNSQEMIMVPITRPISGLVWCWNGLEHNNITITKIHVLIFVITRSKMNVDIVQSVQFLITKSSVHIIEHSTQWENECSFYFVMLMCSCSMNRIVTRRICLTRAHGNLDVSFVWLPRHFVRTRRPFQHIEAEQYGHHFAHGIFKCFFWNGNVWISIKISLKFVSKDRIDNFLALIQIMARRLSSDKPLPELMTVSLLTHVCVARPRWVENIFWAMERF